MGGAFCWYRPFNQAIPFLEDRSDAACRVVFVGLPKRITVLPINKTCYRILVGAMPSGASARPVHVGLAAVRNAERREAHASPRGLRAPATPAPPFFGSPKKGGKESSPLANVPRAFARDALRPPRTYACPRRSESRTHRPTRKSPAARMLPPGAKNAAQASPQKTHHH